MTELLALFALLTAQVEVLWRGRIYAEVVATQPGGEHVTNTIIEVLLLEEGDRTSGGSIRLRGVDSRYSVRTRVTGQAGCEGSADATLSQSTGRSTIDPSGVYHLVLERGFFGWACGRNVQANGARDVVIGAGLDRERRRITPDGRMFGRYQVTQETTDSMYRFKVEWDIKREKRVSEGRAESP
jgi:hypothetical protein